MTEPLPPLSEISEELFTAERTATDFPESSTERIWQQLAVAMPGVVGRNAPQPAARQRGQSAAHVGRKFTLKHMLLASGVTLGTGVAVGVALAPALHVGAPAPVTAVMAPAVPVSAPTAPVAPPAAVPEPLPAPPQAAPRGHRTKTSQAGPGAVHEETKPAPPPSHPLDVDLSAERSLISRARSGLQHGAPQDALVALATHAAQFPAGRLAEEREALRVQALVMTGDRVAAAQAASDFSRKYPQSLMGPAVQAAIQQSK